MKRTHAFTIAILFATACDQTAPPWQGSTGTGIGLPSTPWTSSSGSGVADVSKESTTGSVEDEESTDGPQDPDAEESDTGGDGVLDESGQDDADDEGGEEDGSSDDGSTEGADEGQASTESPGQCALDHLLVRCWYTPQEPNDCGQPDWADPESVCAHQRCAAKHARTVNYPRPSQECARTLCPGNADAWIDAAECEHDRQRELDRDLVDCNERTACEDWPTMCPVFAHYSESNLLESATWIADCIGG